MAADEVQRLDLKDLDAVLAQAKAEGWTQLALLGPEDWAQSKAVRLVREGWSAGRIFALSERLNHVPPTLASLTGLTSLDLSANRIGEAGARAIASLTRLTTLDLGYNQIGNAGAKAIASLPGLTALYLENNQIGDAGASAISALGRLTSLDLGFNDIESDGGKSLGQLKNLRELNLDSSLIGQEGALALAELDDLVKLNLDHNMVGLIGLRAILDAWSDPATAHRRVELRIEGNGVESLLPFELVLQSDAQVIIAAWRQRKEQEAPQEPLPPPEAAGEPVAHGCRWALLLMGG